MSQRSSQFSGEDGNFEQLMVQMLDERDKMMESMREHQERLQEMEARLAEVEKERDALNRQLNANIPQVNSSYTLISLPSKTRRVMTRRNARVNSDSNDYKSNVNKRSDSLARLSKHIEFRG